MAFEIVEFPQFRARRTAVNGLHFWRVSCVDGDTVSGWRPTGFVTQAQDVGLFSTDGVSLPSVGKCRIEINEVPVNIPGFSNPVSDDDRFLAGQAWRFVKDVAVGSGGVFRVRVGVFPGVDWDSDPGTT